MEDIRSRRGDDIASEHHVIVANMWMELKKHWTTERKVWQRFNTAFFWDTNKLNKFMIALNNRFQVIQDLLREETKMENSYKGLEKQ